MSYEPSGFLGNQTPSNPQPASQPFQGQPAYYAQPVYAQPQQLVVQQVVKQPTNGLATTAMVFGIVGIAIGFWAWIPFLGIGSAILGFPLALTATITGHIGLKRAEAMNGNGKNAAFTGTILGYITLGVIVLVTAFWLVMMVIGSISAAAEGAGNA